MACAVVQVKVRPSLIHCPLSRQLPPRLVARKEEEEEEEELVVVVEKKPSRPSR